MEAAGLLDKIEPHTHAVPYGDRGGVPVEPFLTEQWYADAKKLAEAPIAAARDGRVTLRARARARRVLPLDGEHRAVVHLAPALVGPSDPGLVRAGQARSSSR